MKIAIMQPYFFPYMGYWQLIHAVDKFVIYDNIQYSKGGWINRNRILVEGSAKYITLPLKKDSDYLDIRDRYLSDSFASQRHKILNQIYAAYQKAPYFNEVYLLIKQCLEYDNYNLFRFLYYSIQLLTEYMGIGTELLISSHLETENVLKKEKRVISLCKSLRGTQYINPIGGLLLYQKADFEKEGLQLNFLNSCVKEYPQIMEPFVPNLSIVDVLMNNSLDQVHEMLDQFELQ